MKQEPLLQLLGKHQPVDSHEQQMLERIVAFVREYENFYSRDLLVGHLTGSAWIVDETFSHALLLHHGKLNKWLQPGGHIEDDADMLSAALREAREETGVNVHPHSKVIFDVDIHEIPARPNEPAHFHYDVRFLLIADRIAPLIVTSESKDLAWVALEEIETLTQEESVLRMVRKTKCL
ncbi:MAG: NUDIX hydrolase [Acidobacteria bacterium]|nr:NUDIX hydrolase [Acidobacteriota bacterium]